MIIENEYRSHYCGKLNTAHVGEEVKLSGWMHSIRDHGGLVFIYLRDQRKTCLDLQSLLGFQIQVACHRF